MAFTPETLAKLRTARERRPSRRQKMAAYGPTFGLMRKRFPPMALPIIAKAEEGSLPAAVKLVCQVCSSFVRQEIRDCACVHCPLYPHRPYQRLRGKNPNDVGLTPAQ